ncbi:MAG: glycosyltransferase family 9 protein [Vulcanimicrobiaceae bacterium]
MKALVIAAGGGIGDVLLATPVMRALRSRYGTVVGLTAPAHREVLAGNPDLAGVWLNEGPFAALARRIAEARFDAAVVTWATLRTAALPFVGRVPERVGQSRRLYSLLFTRRVEVKSELGDHATHWTQILLDYARALGCDVADATPVFVVPQAARESLARLLGAAGISGPYVVLHPTRGIAAARERWPVAPLAELGRALRTSTGARVVVTGSGADREIAEAVALGAGGVSLGGKASLAEFGALAEGAQAVVAMDSGPMHLAAATGAPTVGIFALRSDEPERWAPVGPRTALVRGTYPCPPQHRKETCPDFACIANLDVARVLGALGGLLERRDETPLHGTGERGARPYS